MWNNLISQAGQMALHGTPNDLLQNLDPIALCIFIPFLDGRLFPLNEVLLKPVADLASHRLSPAAQVQD